MIDKTLREKSISFEAYVRSNYLKIKRIVAKTEKEKAQSDTPPQRAIKKRATGRRRKSSKVTVTIKIPAGKYGNLPAEPDKVFNLKEKGPRPKALKSYAEEIGLEAFLAQCRLDK
ncbi:MAG: hypothetical protein KZQ75_01565 [Candidatus Thiodiazotropha sp. (ex Myrtea spinifera)]|nr:hypothetical protein [Candidatus Thiodiazotropha sp. (ex Myrtea spinifera)]MCU7828535.1 hypothetical protein [Candidatus Thiodiazotropha sp. (ex Myrtea sp. 'scaly one' KF741663)]